jgi:selenide,water dikinase
MKAYPLTQYSHGAGCGCKIAPEVLSTIISNTGKDADFSRLLVGNEARDDAAVYDLDGQTAIISTTDFFMPIVDDPHDFGAIAATNAISDIYAMGGTPIMAIAILGWPVNEIPIAVAGQVLEGGREVCQRAGIPLAGGHSIDAPEPIFGLAVTGKVPIQQVKKNAGARPGDLIYLTKPLGIGLVTTAQKKGLAVPEDLSMAKASMLKLNDIGQQLSSRDEVHAITDVTGFGLAGHLLEVCEASGCTADLYYSDIPQFAFAQKYLAQDCIPGGTRRNWKSYGHKVELKDEAQYTILADPQTSGGLLLAVDTHKKVPFEAYMQENGYVVQPIGQFSQRAAGSMVKVLL